MPSWLWIVIALAAIVVVAVVVWQALSARRTKELQEHFGPEYERAKDSRGNKREAESELVARQARHEQLNIRPLAPEARQRYADEWATVQAQFVDSPAAAASAADGLVSSVMAERGYPMDEFEQRAADVSVDHPQVVQNYRQARKISRASESGKASTEDLRQAMQNYRALFAELLDDSSGNEPVARDDTQHRAETARTATRESVR